jgi:hypothetical protein
VTWNPTPEQRDELQAILDEGPDANGNGHHAEEDARSLIIRASDVRSRSIRWAWTGRLAFGYLTVQTGAEGLGKSVFAAWQMARLSRGELPGLLAGHPVDVLILSSEDGIEDTWKPRLDLADADLERVCFLNLAELPHTWNLRDGIGKLRTAIEESKARVLFIDAALDHMPPPKSGESINSPTFVRQALSPLKRLVREMDLVGQFSMHPPKARSADFRDLVQASQAFAAIPRVGLLFAYHPDDPNDGTDRRRVLLRGKGNIGRDPGAIEFSVGAKPYQHDDGRIADRELVMHIGPSDVTMADLAPDKMIGARQPSKTDQAVEIIVTALADGQWHESAPLYEQLGAHGVGGDSVVRDARRRLGVAVRKRPGITDGPWEWRMPNGGEDVPS